MFELLFFPRSCHFNLFVCVHYYFISDHVLFAHYYIVGMVSVLCVLLCADCFNQTINANFPAVRNLYLYNTNPGCKLRHVAGSRRLCIDMMGPFTSGRIN
jgi:hypothetical protein